MAQIPGTVVAAQVTTGDTSATYSIGDTNEMQGGHHQVADLAARDLISTDRRSEGMLCWVISEQQAFRLIGGIDNADWQPESTDPTGLPLEIAARIYADGTVAQQGSEYAYSLFLTGTNFSRAQDVQIAASGSQFAVIVRDQGTHYTDAQFAVAVLTGTLYTNAAIQAEAAARVFGDGTTLAQAKAYADTVAASSGSDYAFNLFTAGTNYSQTVVSVEAVTRAQHDTDEATARIHGDGTTAQYGSQFAFVLRDQGTAYTNQLSNTEISARILGDAVVAQHGSEFTYDTWLTGTVYTDSKFATAVQNGSQFSTIARDQGTNYTNQQIAGATFGSSGSAFAVILRDQGTNFTIAQVAAEAAARANGDSAVRIYADQQINIESAQRSHDDGTVVQQGSNFSYSLYKTGTNYANSLISGGNGSEFAYDLWLLGTNYTNTQFSTAVQNGSQFSVIVRDQGTNYTDSRSTTEISARILGDSVVAQQGSNFSYGLYKSGTNYANSLVSGGNGSEYAYDLWLTGTTYTNSKVSIAVQNGSQFSVIVRDQGTNYSNQFLPLAGGTLAGDLVLPRIVADKWSNTQTAISFSSAISLDFNTNSAVAVTLTGNGTFSTVNRAAWRMKKVKILCDSSQRNMYFPAWIFIGAAAPTSIAANKTAILSIECWGTNDTDIVAAYAVQP
jgi:hypothetical protein